MSNNELKARLQHAVEYTENYTQHPSNNTIPLKGEMIFNHNLTKFKVGNGEDNYSALSNVNLNYEPVYYSNYGVYDPDPNQDESKYMYQILADNISLGEEGKYIYNDIIIEGNTYYEISQAPEHAVLNGRTTLKPDFLVSDQVSISSLEAYYTINLSDSSNVFYRLLELHKNKFFTFRFRINTDANWTPYIRIITDPVVVDNNMSNFIVINNSNVQLSQDSSTSIYYFLIPMFGYSTGNYYSKGISIKIMKKDILYNNTQIKKYVIEIY